MVNRKIKSFVCTESEPIVQTEAGKIRGYISNKVYCFKGVEYAYAKRFHMPQPVAPWEGVKNAHSHGCGCPEMTYSIRGRNDMNQLMIPNRYGPVSENCQNLNIWTKSISSQAKRPVMVWLHGGAYSGGSATHLFSYDGFEMCNEYDTVVVTVNHRLNMLGFFDLSDFGDRYRNSANLGMADLVAALQWVKKNIAQFGGDPDNVTIYGQSGGGGKVITLMQMPAADGLYHRAIIQSGVVRIGQSKEKAKLLAAKTMALLGLDSSAVKEIETMDYEKLSAAIQTAAREMGIQNTFTMWGPVADGEYYTGFPLDVGFRPETKDIPLIVGSCLAEFAEYIPEGDKTKWGEDKKLSLLTEYFGKGAQQVKKEFQKAYPAIDYSYAVCVDNLIRPMLLDFLNRRTEEAQAPVYNYMFAFESTYMGGQLLGHNGELHFTFHNALYVEAMCKPGFTEKLQDEMAGAWAQFAYAGNPNRMGLPMWTAYTQKEKGCLIYGDNTAMAYKHDKDLLEEVEKQWIKPVFHP